ncbi:SAM-dependent methyltransferase [Jidongwangia harbinensis]|uniref:SAM-dependent methyltransferase n=1 Tax=Jidongwangia harbinensis TaxID=2878561 RepID=UPI001CD987AB|nr:SAM-dependent methyltransferase [Jidongwangia harbinensis]MCA2218126.1 SAM-dependent methyltransferase [Jidongwangia harbinensis]
MTDQPSTVDHPWDAKLDTSVPHSARVWNYWLGGKDNFAVDRAVGDQVRAIYPEIVEIARASRAFLVRSVRFLAGEAGVHQFLDIGTGLPTAGNTHEVAQAVVPTARVVYVDNDPLVLAHARALLSGSREGVTDYVDADVRDTATILREAARSLDLDRPVAVMMLGVLGNVLDTDEAGAVVSRLVAAIAQGSYLVVNDGTDTDAAGVESVRVRSDAGDPYRLRSPAVIARFFDGLDLVEPGVVSTPHWRPDPHAEPVKPLSVACGVARKR